MSIRGQSVNQRQSVDRSQNIHNHMRRGSESMDGDKPSDLQRLIFFPLIIGTCFIEVRKCQKSQDPILS